jgi:3-phosphoshikimate 1-carboxyvinyltransferase
MSITLTSAADGQNLIIEPEQVALKGKIRVPGDKSISHRALILGSISKGQTTIEGLLLGEDPLSTASCFEAMGVKISPLNSDKVVVEGIGLENLQEPQDVLNAGNSGTTMRLILGILAAQKGKFFTITGDSSLRSRPMSRVIKPLEQMGAAIWARKDNTLAPLAIKGSQLQPLEYHSPIASAQVKSCLLLAGLGIEGRTTVIEPALSRDHSERMLEAFGAKIETDPTDNRATVIGPASLVGQRVVVPGDISSAAFWLVAASIVEGSELLIENVGVNPTRTGILEILQLMGADLSLENERIVTGEPVADILVRFSKLKGCEISGAIIPRLIDEIPILAVAAVFAQGITVIKDAAELRVKESDRLAVIARELTKMGAKITELPDGLEITGTSSLVGTTVESCNDHRIAMSLAIASLAAQKTTTIKGVEAATISYPNFVATLQSVCGMEE